MQTVLVIDDDAGIREVIGVMLEKEGFRAIFAADGKTGLQEAMTARPNLIVVDLRMPGLSGVDVCKSLRNAGVQTPLIVLSAIGDEIDKVLMLEIGADDYIVKPFGTRELLARIRAVLRRTTPEANHAITFPTSKSISTGPSCANTATRSSSPKPSTSCWFFSCRTPTGL